MEKRQITRWLQAVLTAVLICTGLITPQKVEASVPYPNSLYLTQQTDVTCTLVSNAMMLRGRTYLSNNSNWTAITESSLEPFGWIENAGQRVNYSATFGNCSFTVNQSFVNGLTLAQLQNILASHPEGVCIYVTSIPHAQWITDIDNGVVYSADSSCEAYFGRRPLANTYQGQCCGYNQNTVLSCVTSYWYVESYDVPANANYVTTSGSQILPNGTYRIASYSDFKYGLEVANKSTANEANVQLNEYSGSDNQKFQVTFSGDHYSIQAVHSGKNLDLYQGRTVAGTNIQQYAANSTIAQKWILKEAGEGAYYIVNGNGLYVDITSGKVANGTNIQGYTGNQSAAQKWYFIAVNGNQSIPDGDYQIHNAKNYTFGVDESTVSSKSGGNVHLWTLGNADNQKWAVKYLGDGYYSIRAKHSGQALNVKDSAYKGYANIQQYPYNDGDASSMWMLKDAGNGSFYVVNKNGLFLDIYNGEIKNGTNLGGWSGNSTDNQKWKFVAVNGTQTIEDGCYNIRCAGNKSLGLDVEAVSTENCANVHIWTIGSGNNQRWNVKHLGSGYYSITAVHSGKALDVANGGINNNNNIQQYTNSATSNDAQQWIIKEAGNGEYYIINKKGLFLDVAGGTMANGTNVQGYVGNRSVAQKWVFTALDKEAPVISDIKISNITCEGYTVTCTVKDNVGVTKVTMPTWTDANGQDDLVWHNATISGTTATFNVKVSDHKNESGKYITHIYAYDAMGNSSCASAGAIDVPADIPVITDVKVTNVTYDGYTVSCTVTSNSQLTKVTMPTWTDANGQDDLVWHNATISGTTATFNVKVSDHKYEAGKYITHIYATNAIGKTGSTSAGSIDVPVNPNVLSNGTYRIASFANNAIGFDVDALGTTNGTNVHLWTYANSTNQQFEITLQDDGYFTIKAVHSGKVVDVSGAVVANGTNIQQYESNNSAAQRWRIVRNNDGSFTLASKLNNNYVIDANNGTIANGTNLQLWPSNGTVAQKWSFIPVASSSTTGYNGYEGGRGGSGNIVAYGVDVSEHQGTGFDFQAIKNAGYSYVILRCGFVTRKDYRFEEYYTAAKAAGLNVGAYFYSYAENASEASNEADKCLSYIAGKKFEYPIYFDFEDQCSYGDDAKTICLTFLDKVASKGYLVGLYSYASWIDEDYNGWIPTATICEKYECWIANYPYADYVDNYTQKYKTRYGMFQFTNGDTSAGLAAGAGIDTNICFKDYPSIVKQYGFNGYTSRSVDDYGDEYVVEPIGIFDSNDATEKTIDRIEYYNVNGQVSNKPFVGFNVIVTIYDDGSQDVKKEFLK